MDILKDFGEPRIKQVMLPKDTNSAGNIFGGWIMSQIDLAGAQAAREISPERVVTISMKEIIFKLSACIMILNGLYLSFLGYRANA